MCCCILSPEAEWAGEGQWDWPIEAQQDAGQGCQGVFSSRGNTLYNHPARIQYRVIITKIY